MGQKKIAMIVRLINTIDRSNDLRADPMCPSDATSCPDSREALIEAALACFSKYGYDATSIRLVASMAGKNSSLISYYFKGKEGLYREVFR